MSTLEQKIEQMIEERVSKIAKDVKGIQEFVGLKTEKKARQIKLATAPQTSEEREATRQGILDDLRAGVSIQLIASKYDKSVAAIYQTKRYWIDGIR